MVGGSAASATSCSTAMNFEKAAVPVALASGEEVSAGMIRESCHEIAAIDRNDRTRHERRRRRREKRRHARDVFGQAPTLHRRAIEDGLRAAVVVLQRL